MSAKINQQVRIQNNLGLHLRAAGALVQLAGKFHSDIQLQHGKLTANAKSIMGVLSLAAAKGTTLTICADGIDAQQAVASLVELIEQGF